MVSRNGTRNPRSRQEVGDCIWRGEVEREAECPRSAARGLGVFRRDGMDCGSHGVRREVPSRRRPCAEPSRVDREPSRRARVRRGFDAAWRDQDRPRLARPPRACRACCAQRQRAFRRAFRADRVSASPACAWQWLHGRAACDGFLWPGPDGDVRSRAGTTDGRGDFACHLVRLYALRRRLFIYSIWQERRRGYSPQGRSFRRRGVPAYCEGRCRLLCRVHKAHWCDDLRACADRARAPCVSERCVHR